MKRRRHNIYWSRRFACQLALAVLLGIVLQQTGSPLAGCCALLLAGFAFLPPLQHRRFGTCLLRGVLLLAAGTLGAGVYAHSAQVWQQEQALLLRQQQVTVRGTLLVKEEKTSGWQLTLRLAGFQNQVIVFTEDGDYPLDCVLSVKGSVKEFQQPRNEGQFNQLQYQTCKRVLAQIFSDEICCLQKPTGMRAWRESLSVLRSRMCAVYEAHLPEQEAGILCAMTAGEKTQLSADVRELFQHAGISHLLAISGMHISLIGMGCYRLLRRCRRSYISSAVCAAVFLVFYLIFIGGGVSARRAVGMLGIYLLAQCLGRRYDLCASLSVLAILLLLDNPFLLSDAGFQFSFLAVAAIVTAQGLQPKLEQKNRRTALMENLLLSVLMQLFTMPLVAYRYFELPLYALAVNLLLLPYAGIAVGCGLAGGLFGVFFAPLGGIFLFPCRVVLHTYVWVCARIGALPDAVFICGQPSAQKLCVYYGSLFAVVFLLEWMQRRMQCAWLSEVQKDREKTEKLEFLRLRQFRRTAAGVAFLAVWLCVCLLHPSAQEQGFEIDYLDVGQGDGALLRTAEGTVCFFDGGSSDVSGVGTYRILPFLKSKGICRVDAWILSHLDEDHVSGFYEVLESGYEIRRVVVSAQLAEDEATKQLYEKLAVKKIPLLRVTAGQQLVLDSAESDGKKDTILRFLSPAQQTPYEDVNGASLVCLYDDGETRALFTGDIGAEQEAWLLAQNLPGAVDLYKSAHHGSKYSNSAEFLQALTPQLSVVSCAKENRYGHPAAEAVENMKAYSRFVRYTMDSGQLQVRRTENGLTVRAFIRGKNTD